MPPMRAPKPPGRGAWRAAGDETHANGKMRLVTWKCQSCGFRAVTKDGEDPGPCGNAKCSTR